MRYLLDTNILSGLVRVPRGPLAQKIAEIGEANVYTSIVVAAEFRFGAAKRGSERLSRQVETVLGAIDIAPYTVSVDRVYGRFVDIWNGSGNRSVRTIC